MDSKKIETILRKGLEKTKVAIQNNLVSNDRVASGKTKNSLKIISSVTASQVKVKLIGSKVLERLEYGRGKTDNPNTKDWKDSLKRWMRIKGIADSLFYQIWRKINAEGWNTTRPNRTNPNGGTKGIISDPINDFKKGVAKDLKVIIIQDFKNNGFNSNQ